MSGGNQIYSNESDKYYDYPGITSYTMSANTPITNAAIPSQLWFNLPNNDAYDDPSSILINPLDMIVQRNGMYSITGSIGVISNLADKDMSVEFIFTLTRPGQFNGLTLCAYFNRIVSLGGGNNSFGIFSFSACMFFKKGDVLTLFLRSNSPQNDENFEVQASSSVLNINKIY